VGRAARRLRSPNDVDIGGRGETAGFTSLWVMDHFLQIPQVGREWQEMLDSYTTLGFLAGKTTTVRLGALVTGVTYRNIAHLGDHRHARCVVSGGRPYAESVAGWFERESKAYGWEFRPLLIRYARLEDALEGVALAWGPGSRVVHGAHGRDRRGHLLSASAQEKVPVLRRRRGRAAHTPRSRRAGRADACNLFGDRPPPFRHKLLWSSASTVNDVGRVRAMRSTSRTCRPRS